jgi:hypothetical protein
VNHLWEKRPKSKPSVSKVFPFISNYREVFEQLLKRDSFVYARRKNSDRAKRAFT